MKQKKSQERLAGEEAWSDRWIGTLEAHTQVVCVRATRVRTQPFYEMAQPEAQSRVVTYWWHFSLADFRRQDHEVSHMLAGSMLICTSS